MRTGLLGNEVHSGCRGIGDGHIGHGPRPRRRSTRSRRRWVRCPCRYNCCKSTRCKPTWCCRKTKNRRLRNWLKKTWRNAASGASVAKAVLERGRRGGAGGFAQILQQQREEQMKKINEVLLAPQQERFVQIWLQVQGTAQDLADAKVAEKLGLTGEQKSKLEELTTSYRQKRMDLVMGGQPDPQERPNW